MFSSSGTLLILSFGGFFATGDAMLWGGWNTQIPGNCARTDNVTNICSTLISKNHTCYVPQCCGSAYYDSDDSGDDDSRSKRGFGGHHGNYHEGCRRCYTQRACTVYKCQMSCCDGYQWDPMKGCIKIPATLKCENGGTVRQNACVCPDGFRGTYCEFPICNCLNGGQCEVRDGRPFCNCTLGYFGNECENAKCLLECFNGGTCIKSGEDEFCKCSANYTGEQCEQSYVRPESCPPPELSGGMCEATCLDSSDCESGEVCCKEGCSTVCRQPRAEYCLFQDKKYPIGAKLNPDACTNCTCTQTGELSCIILSCVQPSCLEGLKPVTKPGHCCPSCPDPNPPVLTNCPSSTVYLNTTLNTDLAVVNASTVPITAVNFKGSKIQVNYTPGSVRHCHCPLTTRLDTSIQANAVDQIGNIATCTFKVAVIDPESPRFSYCPEDIHVTDVVTVTWREPSYTDNVGILAVNEPMISNGKPFPVGRHSIVYTVSDFEGNKAVCNFTVTVVNATPSPPTFRNCPSDVVVLNAISNSSAAELNGLTVALDAYDYAGERLVVTYLPERIEHCRCLNPGISEAHASVVDKHGSQATCPFKVTVRDATPPFFTFCPRDLYVTEGYAVSWMDPTFTDNVGIARESGWTRTSGEIFAVGNHSISYTVWDFDGNAAVCEFVVYVSRAIAIPPTIIFCPLDGQTLKLHTDYNSNAVTLTEENTPIRAHDHYGNKLFLTYEPAKISHCRCYESSITRFTATATARDDKGGVATCSFAVTVKDIESPVFPHCPDDIEEVESTTIVWPTPAVKDNVGIAELIRPNYTSGSFLPIGNYRMDYMARDFDLNLARCSFNVTVIEAPCELSCLNGGVCDKADHNQYCRCTQDFFGRACELHYDHPELCPTPVLENDTCETLCTLDIECDGNQLCCKEGCSSICREARQIYCKVRDRRLTVNEQYGRDKCTNCTCGRNGSLECASQLCFHVFCPYGRQPKLDPSMCCPVCPDDPPPEAVTFSNCPTDVVSLSTDIYSDDVILTTGNTYISIPGLDDFTADEEVVFKPQSVKHCACYNSSAQRTQIEAKYIDMYGNAATCTFNVTVRDLYPPYYYACPLDMFVFDNETVKWKEPRALDNVKVARNECSTNRNGEEFAVGEYTVTYKAWDYDGNTGTCSFKIHVIQSEADLFAELKAQAEKHLVIIFAPILGVFLAALVAFLVFCYCRRHLKEGLSFKSPTKTVNESLSTDSNVYPEPSDVESIRKQSKRSRYLKPQALTPENLSFHNALYEHPLREQMSPPPSSSYRPPAYSDISSVNEWTTGRSIKDVIYMTIPSGFVNPCYEAPSVHSHSRSCTPSKPRSTESSRTSSSRRSERSSVSDA